jgi:hypothetical protein
MTSRGPAQRRERGRRAGSVDLSTARPKRRIEPQERGGERSRALHGPAGIPGMLRSDSGHARAHRRNECALAIRGSSLASGARTRIAAGSDSSLRACQRNLRRGHRRGRAARERSAGGTGITTARAQPSSGLRLRTLSMLRTLADLRSRRSRARTRIRRARSRRRSRWSASSTPTRTPRRPRRGGRAGCGARPCPTRTSGGRAGRAWRRGGGVCACADSARSRPSRRGSSRARSCGRAHRGRARTRRRAPSRVAY